MPPVSQPGIRFKEGSGERFLENGAMRCHALARSKIRAWREAYDDYDTPTELLWPECQCGLGAEDGQFVCRFHGGKSPRTKNPPRSILDVMPLDMAQKFRAVMESSDYISRKDDIILFKTRIMMLLEDLDQEASSEEAWASVHEALVKLQQGDTLNAIEYLKYAISAKINKQEIWQEIHKAEKMLSDLTTTQVRTAKELQSMATAEQVNALITSILQIIMSGATEYISDPMQRSEYTRRIVRELQEVTGTTAQQMVIDAEHTD
jgi:hypothetical protein